jgi:hypothetical protein
MANLLKAAEAKATAQQVAAAARPRVRHPGPLPVAGRRSGRSGDPGPGGRRWPASTRPTASSTSPCCARRDSRRNTEGSTWRRISTALGRSLADRALHPAAGRLRTQAASGNTLSRDHQRSHRTGQDLRRHRRPQVRQRRAGQAGRRAAGCRDTKALIPCPRNSNSSRAISRAAPRTRCSASATTAR